MNQILKSSDAVCSTTRTSFKDRPFGSGGHMRVGTVSVGDITDRIVEDSEIIKDVTIPRLPDFQKQHIGFLPVATCSWGTIFGMIYGLVGRFGFQYVRTVSRVCFQY